MAAHDFPYHLVDRWIETFPKLRVLGPLTVSSPDYARVHEFRREWHQRDAPYLTETAQLEIEHALMLDERSLHFALECDGQIVACVRATPLPFEISALHDDLIERATRYQNYYEFSRLCTNTRLGRKGLYASLLVVKAAQFLFSNQLAEGIIGICRVDRVSYMKRLGLDSDALTVWLEPRNGNYHLVRASKDELLRFYSLRLNEVFSRQNLEVLRESHPA